jgi:hypothetical protein
VSTNRRRYSRTRSAGSFERNDWNDYVIEFMSFGVCSLGDFKDIEGAAEYWEAHGEAITEEYIAQYPGHRPAAWWHFTHRKSRPIVNPLPAEEEGRWRQEYTHAGVLHSAILHGHCNGVEARHTAGTCRDERCVMVPWQEDQAGYLDRMGLLTDDERRVLELAPAIHPASRPRGPHKPRR